MDFPKHILSLKGSQVEITKFWYISVPENVFILSNSEDPDVCESTCLRVSKMK